MYFAPKAFSETRVSTAKNVEEALKEINYLNSITPAILLRWSPVPGSVRGEPGTNYRAQKNTLTMIGKGKSISHGVAALVYDLAKEIIGQAVATEIARHELYECTGADMV